MTIREHRKAKHLTLHQLSALCNVSVQQIQAVEVGKSDPGNMSARNLLKIAKVLESDPFELVPVRIPAEEVERLKNEFMEV